MTPPDLLLFGDYDSWDDYCEVLYQVFCDEIRPPNLSYNDTRITCRRTPETYGKWNAFWHLVQEGKIEDDRTPDLRRCERLKWVAFVISNFNLNPDIQVWENPRRKTVLFWYREEYLVVLSKRSDYYLLKTAYCTEKPHRKEALRQERDKFGMI
jgi:hypothetical protein